MRISLKSALIACALALPLSAPVLAPPVQAEEAVVVELLEALGYPAYARHLEGLYRAAPDDPTMSARQTANWERAAANLFSADAILAAAAEGLAEISEEDLASLQAFYASDLGLRVTAMEVAVQDPGRVEEIEAAVEGYADDLAAMPADRRALIDRLESALGSTDDTVVQVMNFQIGLMQGMVDANPDAMPLSTEEILLQVQANADLIRAEIEESAGRWAAYTYRELEDADLEAYAAFLERPAAQALYRLTDDAVLRVLERDAYLLGKTYALFETSQEL